MKTRVQKLRQEDGSVLGVTLLLALILGVTWALT